MRHGMAMAAINRMGLDPKQASGYFGRGNVWYAAKEFDSAIADYTEAIRLDPRNVAAYTWRGKFFSKKKEYDKAIADYGRAIEIEPKCARSPRGPRMDLGHGDRSQDSQRQTGHGGSHQSVRADGMGETLCPRRSCRGLCRDRRLHRGSEMGEQGH